MSKLRCSAKVCSVHVNLTKEHEHHCGINKESFITNIASKKMKDDEHLPNKLSFTEKYKTIFQLHSKLKNTVLLTSTAM